MRDTVYECDLCQTPNLKEDQVCGFDQHGPGGDMVPACTAAANSHLCKACIDNVHQFAESDSATCLRRENRKTDALDAAKGIYTPEPKTRQCPMCDTDIASSSRVTIVEVPEGGVSRPILSHLQEPWHGWVCGDCAERIGNAHDI